MINKNDNNLISLSNRYIQEEHRYFDAEANATRSRCGDRVFDTLNSDADAFHGAVLCNLNTFSVKDVAYAMPSEDDGANEVLVDHGKDRFAAMRRAITICLANTARDMFE